MAKRKTKAAEAANEDAAEGSVEKLKKRVAAYEQVFDEVQHFIDLIHRQDQEVSSANEAMYKAKEAYEQAKSLVSDCRDARDGTKHALFMFLKPGPAEILPLFDRMEPADEKEHGKGASEWRKEPISALRLSMLATSLLTAADIIFVGQLQDRVQADADSWWESIDGLDAPKAAAIADRLADFIEEHTK